MGDPDKQKLQTNLEAAGWQVERRPGEAWWQHELWKLTSDWRPRSAVAFITLLIDPASERSDIVSVWAISVSRDVPTDWLEGNDTIRVSPRLQDRLDEVVALAARLRPTA